MEPRRFTPPAALRALIGDVASLARERDSAAYIVGGTVRDVLLGRPVRDLDIAVERDAMSFGRALAGRLGGHFVPLDEVNVIARVVLDAGDLRCIDVAQLQGRVEEDLRRRDFTIDALAVSVDDDRVVDVTAGVKDLDAGVVRMTSSQVFAADPLRLMRAVRIATELGFAVDGPTAAAIRERAGSVNAAAAERRRDELARILSLDAAGRGIRLLDHLDLLDELLPELAPGRGCTQPENYHSFDVFEHNVRTLEAMDAMLARAAPTGGLGWLHDVLWHQFARWKRELRGWLAEEPSEGRSNQSVLKLTALLHDVGKPQSRTVEPGGRIRFFGHADAGAEIAVRIMRRLRFSTRESALVSLMVAEHMRPVQLAQVGEVPTNRALYRFHRDAGAALPAILLLALADASGARGERMSKEDWSRQAAYMNGLLVRLSEEEGIVDAPRLLTGHDIIAELGLDEGPLIGRLLEAVREAQATGEVRDRESALAVARAQLVRHKGRRRSRR